MTMTALDNEQVRRVLPHRYPFLLVDKVVSISDDTVVAVKNVTANEPYFQGHFPERPVMPGVLVVEALAQTTGVLFGHLRPETLGWDVALVGVDKFRFRRPVVPGDVLILTATLIKGGQVTRPWRFRTEAAVDGKRAADGEISAMVMPPDATRSTRAP